MDGIADRVAQALDEVEEQVLSDSAKDPRRKPSAACGLPLRPPARQLSACASCSTASSRSISMI